MTDYWTGEVWRETKDELPPEGEVVEVMNGSTVTTLVRQGRLWFFPDMSMYVYYTPRVWRSIPASASQLPSGDSEERS